MYTVLRFISMLDGIVIVVEKLSKSFGAVEVLKSMDFVVPPNQVVGFLGVNGAGKTTTMRILSTALKPSSGSVHIGDCDVVQSPEAARAKIGYLPEKPPLYPQLSIGRYLEFLAGYRCVPSPRQAIGTALERVGLLGKENVLISKLSKGYQQRVGLAQAILHEPTHLILDEPASGLDPSQLVEIREMLRDLAEDTSVLLSTHLLSEAERMCSHHIILHQGTVAASGSLDVLGQKLGNGGLSLKLSIDGWNHTFLKQLSELEVVEQVSIASHGEKDVNLFVGCKQQSIPIVLSWSAKHELQVMGYQWTQPSLEDCFLSVVGVEQ